jgi:hypothetical protein
VYIPNIWLGSRLLYPCPSPDLLLTFSPILGRRSGRSMEKNKIIIRADIGKYKGLNKYGIRNLNVK